MLEDIELVERRLRNPVAIIPGVGVAWLRIKKALADGQKKADNRASTPCGECKWNSINNLQCDTCCHAFHSQFAQRT